MLGPGMPRRRRRLRLLASLALLVGAALAAVLLLGADKTTDPHPKRARGTPQAPAAKPEPRPRIVHGPHREPVPILMYHVVSERQPGAPYPDLYTPKRVF